MKKTKATYRIRNWHEYNASLIKRGSLELWIDQELQEQWQATEKKGRGHPQRYSEQAIRTVLILRAIFHLPFRATQGMLASIFSLAKIDLPVPTYTTLHRRMRSLRIELPLLKDDEPLIVAIDSSGFKIFGEGEWKVRQHGVGKRRVWRKEHVVVVAAGKQKGMLTAGQGTDKDVADSAVLEELLKKTPQPIAAVAGDGAYDTMWERRLIAQRGAEALIPPRENATHWPERTRGIVQPGAAERNAALDRIADVGQATWKEEVGYHRRSLVENTFYRLKTIFGERLMARRKQGDTQDAELAVRRYALNAFTQLGMPQSVPVSRAQAA